MSMQRSVQHIRWFIRIAVVAALAAGCDAKGSSFFTAPNGTSANLRDLDAPFFSFTRPLPILSDRPYNIANSEFRLFDNPSANGAPASGVDPASVEMFINGVRAIASLLEDGRYRLPLNTDFGSVNLTGTARDFAGNIGTGGITFNVDRVAPVHDFVQSPPAQLTVEDPFALIAYSAKVLEPYLKSSVGSVYLPVNGSCANATQLIPVGTGGNQVDNNTWDYFNAIGTTGGFNTSFRLNNPTTQPGQTAETTICTRITSSDNAVDENNADKPNVQVSDFQTVILWTHWRVFGSIAGRVTMQDGSGVAGVVVSAAGKSATTDQSGAYRIDAVAPGNGIVVQIASAPVGVVCTPGSRIVDLPDTGGTATADFQCSPAPGSITGTVKRDDGTPISGVVLSVAGGRTATTDAAGVYRFDDMNPGPNLVFISGGLPQALTCTPDQHNLTIVAGETATADFICEDQAQTSTVQGTVMVNGQPVPNATVRIGQLTALTNALGQFIFTGILFGTYNMSVENHPTYMTCPSQALQILAATLTVAIVCNPIAFTMLLTGSYRHFTGFSEVCLLIATNPLLAGALYSAVVNGGQVSGTRNFNGTLNAQGQAQLRATILVFGVYTWFVTVLNQTLSAEVNVTGASGSCT